MKPVPLAFEKQTEEQCERARRMLAFILEQLGGDFVFLMYGHGRIRHVLAAGPGDQGAALPDDLRATAEHLEKMIAEALKGKMN